jgi:CRP-like cAMP-binding protein
MPSLNSDSTDDRVSLLSAIDLFRQVKKEALSVLASHMKRVTFKTSDTVVTAGAQGDSMFIVIEGLLDVYVRDETDNREVKVGHITSGQFFGEIALLTGRPRSATVIASTDVVAYEITHDCMWEFLHQYPDMLKEMSEVVANLQLHEQRFLDGIHQPALVQSHQSLSDEILMSIRNFFGISRRR